MSHTNIILVCIGNFQEYILHNIHQLIRLGHENIYVLTNLEFFERFRLYKEYIRLVNIDDLSESYQFYQKTSLNKEFRGGFWSLTSLRFFYIYEFMRLYNIVNAIHLENDVLIYYNCDYILNCFDSEYMYLPFDTFSRNIASICYIPSAQVFKRILDQYNFDKDDMTNFSVIQRETGLIRNLPIFPTCNINPEYEFITSNFIDFNGFIFDAAAIGQMLGGVDPRNIAGDTTGFINETCIIKYNTYSVFWEITDNIRRPYIRIDDVQVPIFNLHIHSKSLLRFM